MARALRRSEIKKSLLIALGVGSVLFIINQSESLFGGPYAPLLAFKIPLTFLIPFVASSISAALNRSKK